ncbi:MAG: hypothetical protein Hyperionvirus4_65 [Hyperionvirus sp.]|uniref:SAP domain-containing protein n=1 Tax=Hyperionvirus sp. TaxID=2487770 RepID=A0A3G5A766_9VIRU|nr:MAG: hypothetical protein Hyperionvirus4_65 [Hyperionvirus sp.]
MKNYVIFLEKKIREMEEIIKGFRNELATDTQDLGYVHKIISNLADELLRERDLTSALREEVTKRDDEIAQLKDEFKCKDEIISQNLETPEQIEIIPKNEEGSPEVLDVWLETTIEKLGFDAEDYRELIDERTFGELKNLCKVHSVDSFKNNKADMVGTILGGPSKKLNMIVKDIAFEKARDIMISMKDPAMDEKYIVKTYSTYSLSRSSKKAVLVLDVAKLKIMEELFVCQLKNQTVKKLKEICMPYNVSKSGKKSDIVNRLAIAKALEIVKPRVSSRPSDCSDGDSLGSAHPGSYFQISRSG